MVRSFTAPSVFSLISHVVPKGLQAEAAAWNSSAIQLAAIFGPALGGLLYGHFGPLTAFAAPPVFMVGALFLQTLFSENTRTMRSPSQREPFFASVHSGIRFALQQKVLLSSMTLDMFSVLFGGAVAILPVFSDQVLHAGSEGLGFLRAAPSVGSAVMALFLALRPLRMISGRMLLMAVAGFGLCILGFAVSREFWLTFFFLAASGAFDGVSMVIRNTLLQLYTPAHMRGRISSLSLIFITSSNEIGAFESGVAARLLGLIPSILFGGAMTLFVVGTTAWLSPELRRTRFKPGEDFPGN
jgi:MFS family permease